MNEQMQEKLIQFMDKALNGIDASVSFMSNQLPDYIEQLLMWNIVSNIGFLIVFPVLIVISVRYLIKTYGDESSWAHDSFVVSFEFGFLSAICLTASIIVTVESYSSIMEVIKILISPKVWLVEYVAEITK